MLLSTEVGVSRTSTYLSVNLYASILFLLFSLFAGGHVGAVTIGYKLLYKFYFFSFRNLLLSLIIFLMRVVNCALIICCRKCCVLGEICLPGIFDNQ